MMRAQNFRKKFLPILLTCVVLYGSCDSSNSSPTERTKCVWREKQNNKNNHREKATIPKSHTSNMKALSLFFIFSFVLSGGDSFSLVMMGRRGRKGSLKRSVEGASSSSSVASKNVNSINQGRGQEITGVTLPAANQIKGWEFGEKKTMVCANVDDRFYALEGQCPRCGFDLFKGDLLVDDPGWEDLPRVACPTCATTYSLQSGKFGPPLKRTGLSGFVSNLAKSATQGDKPRDAQPFQITFDEDGRVYCRSKSKTN